MVTEDFVAGGGPAALTGGAPLPGDRPLGRPMTPNVESRGVPGGGLLANGGKAPLPESWQVRTNHHQIQNKNVMQAETSARMNGSDSSVSMFTKHF